MTDAPKIDYSGHPAFPLPADVFSLDEEFEMHFESLYSRFSDRSVAYDTDAGSLLELLNSLFETWRPECHTNIEVLFVDTLEEMCARVLREQDEYFSLRRSETSKELSAATATLRLEERYLVGELSTREAVRLCTIASSELKVFRHRANVGLLKRTDLSIGRGRTVSKLVRSLNASFDSNGVLDWVSNAFGTRMVVAGLALELSDARSDWWRHSIPEIAPPRTMYAHVDETIGVPKAIVYLSDVSPLNGPTSCYPRLYEDMKLSALSDLFGRALSKLNEPGLPFAELLTDGKYHQAQSSLQFRQLFMRLPPPLRFYSHLGWNVIPGSDLETDMVRREEFLLGPSGTYIVFDGGKLFHRGGLIEEGERIALQVLFRPIAQTRFQSRLRRRIRRMLNDWNTPHGSR